MKKKPIIGLSPNYITNTILESLGSHRLFVNEDYMDAVTQVGGIPLILPIGDLTAIAAYLNVIDGLILTGGNDIDPLLYGEEPSPHLTATRPERDAFEIALVKETLKQKKPIFGICRGMQLLNVSLGGTLYQDIPSEFPGAKVVQHRQHSKENIASHTVDLLNGSKLKMVMKTETLVTNSFHHQSIKKLAPGLIISALAKDGVIEGIEMPEANFVVAVQWHPECMVKTDPQMLHLFTHFVNTASLQETSS